MIKELDKFWWWPKSQNNIFMLDQLMWCVKLKLIPTFFAPIQKWTQINYSFCKILPHFIYGKKQPATVLIFVKLIKSVQIFFIISSYKKMLYYNDLAYEWLNGSTFILGGACVGKCIKIELCVYDSEMKLLKHTHTHTNYCFKGLYQSRCCSARGWNARQVEVSRVWVQVS